ncbi:MAG: GerW family sporulation protein [Lachnospiraceae bacterium]|nr:GerW family sporulation protein [Lachnospiraceae bacterium]
MAEKEENAFSEVMGSLIKGMDGILSSKTVVGQPTILGDVTIIPLVDVTVGAGAGSSLTDKKGGGGGGFSAKMSPAAVLVIKDGVTKVVNVKDQDAVTKVIDLVPDLVNKFMAGKKDLPDDEEVMDIAFPEDDK